MQQYLHFCCFAGEAILCFKLYFQIAGSSKENERLNRIKFLFFIYDINDLLFFLQNH